MAKRQSIPPAEVLFSGRTPAEAPEAATPKHVKVTVYMPPEMVADLDDLRAEIRRSGATVDRGQLVRSAIRMALAHSSEWVDKTLEDN